MYWRVDYADRPSTSGVLTPGDQLFQSIRKMLWHSARGGKRREHGPKVVGVTMLDIEGSADVPAWNPQMMFEVA